MICSDEETGATNGCRLQENHKRGDHRSKNAINLNVCKRFDFLDASVARRAISNSTLECFERKKAIFLHGKNGFAEESENLIRYRSKNNFVGSSK